MSKRVMRAALESCWDEDEDEEGCDESESESESEGSGSWRTSGSVRGEKDKLDDPGKERQMAAGKTTEDGVEEPSST